MADSPSPNPKSNETGENLFSGKVIVKGTFLGVPNLLVVAYDLDAPSKGESDENLSKIVSASLARSWIDFPGDRIGSVLTGEDGSFRLEYSDAAFQPEQKDEYRPDLVFFILSPDTRLQETFFGQPVEHRLLHYAFVARKDAGREEALIVALEQSLLAERAIAYPGSQYPSNVERVDDASSILRSEDRRTSVTEALRNAGSQQALNSRIAGVERARLASGLISPAALSTKRSEDGARGHYVASFAPPVELISGLSAPILSREGMRVEARLSTTTRIESAFPIWLSVEPTQPFQFRLSPVEAQRLGLPEVELTTSVRETLGTQRAFEEVTRTVQEAMNGHSGPLERMKRRRRANKLVEEAVREPTVPVLPEGGSGPNGETTFSPASWVDRVASKLKPSEEPGVRITDTADVSDSAAAFNLRASPSDVPSFHDYVELQLALPHVWTELFNQDILDAGQRAYERVVRVVGGEGSPPPTAQIETIDDLLALQKQDAEGGGAAEQPNELVSVLLPELTSEQWSHLSEHDREGMINIATRYGAANAVAGTFGPPSADIVDRLARLKLQVQRELRARFGAGLLGTLGKTILDLESEMLAPHKFEVFVEDSVNFGLMTTIRQMCRPTFYQVGSCKKTITLTPGETLKFSTKIEETKSRKTLEKENASETRRRESEVKGRAEKELAQRVEQKTDFKSEAEASGSVGLFSASGSASFGMNTASATEAKRRSLRETTKKEAEEIKKDTSLSVEISESYSRQTEFSQTLTNANQEIAVTWMFYELQRQFGVSERIQSVEPVLLIANAMPAPHEITPSWLMVHDWNLRRRILDDQFLDTLDYLSNDFSGERAQLRFLHSQLSVDLEFLEKIEQEQENVAQEMLETQNELEGIQAVKADRIYRGVKERRIESARELEGNLETTLDEISQRFNTLRSRSEQAYSAYRERVVAIGELMQRVISMDIAIRRLAIHIAQNISYYMQGIWESEPQDQRFLRLHDVKVPKLAVDLSGNSAVTCRLDPLTRETICDVEIPSPTGLLPESEWQTAGEAAELGSLMGFFGNYGVYRLKEPHLLTTFMGRGYYNQTGVGRVGDAPSEEELLQCFRDIADDWRSSEEGEVPEAVKSAMNELLTARLNDPGLAEEMIVLPMDAMFVEALTAKHPVLEDYKLKHRKHDLRKAEIDALIAESELGRRLEKLRSGDLEAEPSKIVRVDGAASVNVDDD